MKLVKQSAVVIEDNINDLSIIEHFGRVSHKSEARGFVCSKFDYPLPIEDRSTIECDEVNCDKCVHNSSNKFSSTMVKINHNACLEAKVITVSFVEGVLKSFEGLLLLATTSMNDRAEIQPLINYFSLMIYDNRTVATANARTWKYLFDYINTDDVSKNLDRLFKFSPSNREILGVLSKAYPAIFSVPSAMVSADDVSDTVRIEDVDKYKDHPNYKDHKHMTVRMITNRSSTHELVRHRPCSYLQESQRYVKYDGGLEIIDTTDFYGMYKDDVIEFYEAMEKLYIEMRRKPNRYYKQTCGKLIQLAEDDNVTEPYTEEHKEVVLPEIARGILANDVKTEIIMTTSLREWQHVFNLRVEGTTGRPHSYIKELISPVHEEFKERFEGIII